MFQRDKTRDKLNLIVCRFAVDQIQMKKMMYFMTTQEEATQIPLE
jgi:hypothetical protein